MSRSRHTSHSPVVPIFRRRIRWAVVAVGVLVMVAVVACGTGAVTAKRPTGGTLPKVELTRGGVPGARDGRLPPGGVSASEQKLPGIKKFDPALRDAVRRAAEAAAAEGISVNITSGLRSRRYQQDLLDRAIVTYGSRAEALRFVALPEESRHITGDAVDIGPTDAAYWFAQHGSEFGLCQTFANEVWHYELLVEPGGTCPQMRADGSS